MNDEGAIPDGARPTLEPFTRLQEDPARGGWVLQAPERVIALDEIAHEIVRRCDGVAAFSEIIEILATEYDAPRDEIADDVGAVLSRLSELGFLRLRDGG